MMGKTSMQSCCAIRRILTNWLYMVMASKTTMSSESWSRGPSTGSTYCWNFCYPSRIESVVSALSASIRTRKSFILKPDVHCGINTVSVNSYPNN